jgi:hypothetical protein
MLVWFWLRHSHKCNGVVSLFLLSLFMHTWINLARSIWEGQKSFWIRQVSLESKLLHTADKT